MCFLNNGETTPAIQIDRQGIYEVMLANACDTVTKTFEVTLDYCECPVYVPNAFTPDNDGANDLFRPFWDANPTAICSRYSIRGVRSFLPPTIRKRVGSARSKMTLHPRNTRGISRVAMSTTGGFRWNSQTKKIRCLRRALNFKGTST